MSLVSVTVGLWQRRHTGAAFPCERYCALNSASRKTGSRYALECMLCDHLAKMAWWQLPHACAELNFPVRSVAGAEAAITWSLGISGAVEVAVAGAVSTARSSG